MCGICGMALSGGREASLDLLRRMNQAMAHRGPDGEGFYLDGPLGLGHRRLSIIDLEGGAQPIENEDGSLQVILNGEIYNYQELTRELKAQGHVFQTQSDTETLVHLYEQYGLDMVHHLRGMFAFALYDQKKGALFLVRDRFGIKPLYFHQRDGSLYFASEIRPLLVAGCPVEVNQVGIHHYLLSRFAHGDETIFKGVHRLPEGSILSWRRGEADVSRYYPNPRVESLDAGRDHQERYEAAVADAVRLRMIADVPVGAYLSGGVDSSVVVSEMTRFTDMPVETFCVDFAEGLTEAPAARKTAELLGCDHHTVICGVEELLELPRVVQALEEPVGDGVTVPVFFLSRATRAAGVKTVLTGDGADETLGGYQFIRAAAQAALWGRRLPGFLFSPLGRELARRLPSRLLLKFSDLPFDASEDVKLRLVRLLDLVPRRDCAAMFDLLTAMFLPEELPKICTDSFTARGRDLVLESFAGPPRGLTAVDQALSLQYRKWLPGNINLKQDKLCMAHSVENRTPFLDHKLVELVTRFPASLKMKGKSAKLPLRKLALRKGLDQAMVSKSKVPFYLPLEHYLKDARLWDMIDENTDADRVRRRGILRPAYIKAIKQKARDRDFLAAKKLLALVILELWHRIFVDGEQAASPGAEAAAPPPDKILVRHGPGTRPS